METEDTEKYFKFSNLPLVPFSQLLIMTELIKAEKKSILMDRLNQISLL